MNVLIYCLRHPVRPMAPIVQRRIEAQPGTLVWNNSDGGATNRGIEIRDKFNRGRQMALDGDYDAMLCVEDDMILPFDALERLADVGADITYSLYVSRQDEQSWLVADAIAPTRLRLAQPAAVQANTIYPCVGIGQGCTLIRRNVLETIPFRLIPENPNACPDWPLGLDAEIAGFTQAVHTGVRCGHAVSYAPTWAVFPGYHAPWVERWRILDDGETPGEGRTFYHCLRPLERDGDRLYPPGDVIALTDDTAQIHLSRGQIIIYQFEE